MGQIIFLNAFIRILCFYTVVTTVRVQKILHSCPTLRLVTNVALISIEDLWLAHGVWRLDTSD